MLTDTTAIIDITWTMLRKVEENSTHATDKMNPVLILSSGWCKKKLGQSLQHVPSPHWNSNWESTVIVRLILNARSQVKAPGG